MSVKKAPGGQMNRDRYAELKRILEERRREILSAVHDKIRDVRTEGANSTTARSPRRRGDLRSGYSG